MTVKYKILFFYVITAVAVYDMNMMCYYFYVFTTTKDISIVAFYVPFVRAAALDATL